MRYSNKYKQNGTAVFMALLMVAIVASIAFALSQKQRIDIKRTQLLVTTESSYLYAQGAVDWAISQLQLDTVNPLSPAEWPLALTPTAIEDGQGVLTASLINADGLFNLNNFANLKDDTKDKSAVKKPSAETQKQILLSIIQQLNVPISDNQIQEIIVAIEEWVTPISPNNKFDLVYQQQIPPYHAPHRPMASVSELRTVAGMTPELYSALLPYVIALPEYTTINADYAPPLIQQALNSQGSNQPKSGKYFLLRADVQIEGHQLTMYCLLQKNNDNVSVLWRSFNTL